MKTHRRFAFLLAPLAIAIALIANASRPIFAQNDSNNDTVLVANDDAAGGGNLKTLAVIAVESYSDLIADVNFLGKLSGKPELGQMVEGGLAFFTQGKGPEAIDKTKPWGMIVQTDGTGFLPVICLPVKNIDDLLAVATAYGVKVNDGDKDTKVLALPNGQSIHVKENGGWAYISNTPDSLEQLPAQPQDTLAGMVKNYDIAIRIMAKNAPENYKQMAIQGMKAGMDRNLQKKEDESDEEFEKRQKTAQAQLEQTIKAINEIDRLDLGWNIDAEQQRTYLDFAYVVKAGSELAEQLKAYDDPRTNFAGFYQPDSAATATLAMQGDPKLIEKNSAQFDSVMQQMRDQFNKAVDQNENFNDEEVKTAVKAGMEDWFAAVESTMRAGRFDAGAALNVAPGSMTLVVGARVLDTAKVEAGLKKMAAVAEKKKDETNFKGVEWNAAEHAGVKFHTLKFKIPEDQEAPRRMLGDEANIAVGIGAEAIYLGVGRDNIEAVNKAIDASAAEPDKKVPPFELAISIRPIVEMAAAEAPDASQKEILEKVADMLKNEAEGRDHIRIVGSVVPNGLRYRFEVEEGVLRGLGTYSTEQQRQALAPQTR